MIKFLYLLSVIAFYIIKDIECSNIYDALRNYYDSDIHTQFEKEWKQYRHAFENEIASSLQQNFGSKALNIYEPDRHDAHYLAGGFHLTDGVVMVYFFEMVLRELPALIGPKLNLDLPSNYVKVESKVDRMFIDTTYYVARNSSSVIYASPDDQKDLSPFSLQQVDNFGRVVIVVEDCSLSGISIATMNGDSVNMGHSSFMLSNCKFTVEISTPNSGAPPVIAPYFPKGPKEKLEIVISKPIREELHTKLQGAMYSYINTTVVLGSKVSNFRNSQHQLFKSYAEFMTDYVAKVNQKTLTANKGHVNLANYEILMNTETDKAKWQCHMALKDVMLYGLDTAYVARSGGPYKDGSEPNTAADAVTFSSIQIHGKVSHDDDGKGSTTHDFAAELTDITVNIIIDIQKGRTELRDILLTGWRSLEFSIIPWETQYTDRHGYQSLVYGHMLNELPVRIKDHLTSILGAPIDGNKQGDDDNNYDDGGDGDGGDGDGGDVAGNEEEGRDENGGVDDNDDSGDNTAKEKQLNNKDEFFSDGLDENFFSDEEFFSDDVLDENFFSDDNLENDFLSEFETDGKKDNVEDNEVLGGGEPSENSEDNEGVKDADGKPNMAVSDAENAEGLTDTGDDGGVNDDAEGVVDTIAEVDVGVDDDAVADIEVDVGVDDDVVADNEGNIATFKSDDNDRNVGSQGKLKSVNGQGVEHDFIGWPMQDDEEESMISQDGFNKLALDGSQLKSVKGDDFLSDDFLDKDFFSDDNLQEDFISDMTAENNEAPLDEAVEDGAEGAAEGEDEGAVEDEDEGAVADEDEGAVEDGDEGAVEDGDEGAVEDDDGKQTNDDVAVDDDTKKKDFLSDEHIQKDFLSEEHIQKDFLSDEHIQKDFFSDGHIEENFFSDDHLEKDFFSDDNTNSQGDVAANGLQSDNGDGGLKESDNAINEDVNDSADIKATPVEDNNDEIADSDRGNNNDEQNAGDTGVKKMWAVDSEEGKPFLDENFFSDDNIERRSMADKSQRYGANNHTDDKHAVTIEGETTKKGNDSSEDIKVLPTNVHNTRRQQNLHMLENEIR